MANKSKMKCNVVTKSDRAGKKKMVKAPSGYHWMSKGGRYFLMEHSGKFVPHKNAATEMPFKILSAHQ